MNSIDDIRLVKSNSSIIQSSIIMASQNILRSKLKSHSCLYQTPALPQQEEPQLLLPQLHSQKMDLDKQDEQVLFEKVLAFLKEFFTNEHFHKELFVALNKQKSSKMMGSLKQNQRIVSFKKMNMGSRVCFDGEVTKKQDSYQKQFRAPRCNNKKISIFIMEEANSESSEDFSDQFISENSVKTIRSIQIPHMDMNIQTISLIYEGPQPFLINLSLCLFVRYCLLTKHEITFQGSSWVLTVATIIAYKLYYDQEIEGLMECFMNVMNIERKDLIDLERCFFQEIDYNTVISNYDYHFILSKLLSMKVKQEKASIKE